MKNPDFNYKYKQIQIDGLNSEFESGCFEVWMIWEKTQKGELRVNFTESRPYKNMLRTEYIQQKGKETKLFNLFQVFSFQVHGERDIMLIKICWRRQVRKRNEKVF